MAIMSDLNEFVMVPIEDIPFHNTPVMYVGVLGILAWIAVLLRLYTRTWILRSLGWDDYTMVMALMSFTVYGIFFVLLHAMITGKTELSLRQYEKSLQYLLVVEQMYTLTILVLKISLAIFFLRILPRTWHRWIIYAMVTLSTLYGTAYFLFSIFQCGYFSSIEEFAVKRLNGTQCVTGMQALIISFTHAAITATTDWTFAGLGLLVTMRLNINLRNKLIIFLILTLGTTGSIASIVRFPYVSHSSDDAYSFYTNVLGLGVWSWWEMGLGIIAGSLATLRPLFRKVFGSRRNAKKVGNSPFIYEKNLKSDSLLNLAFPFRLHKRSSSGDSSSTLRKSLIGWPLERANTTKKIKHLYHDEEELLWGWGPKQSSAATGNQKFGNIVTVTSQGDWNGEVATRIATSKMSRLSKRASSLYPEDELPVNKQRGVACMAPLPPLPVATPVGTLVPTPRSTSLARGSLRGARPGQQMRWQVELANQYRGSVGQASSRFSVSS